MSLGSSMEIFGDTVFYGAGGRGERRWGGDSKKVVGDGCGMLDVEFMLLPGPPKKPNAPQKKEPAE